MEGWGLKLLCKEKRWNSDSLTVIETPQVGLLCAVCPCRNCPLELQPHGIISSKT